MNDTAATAPRSEADQFEHERALMGHAVGLLKEALPRFGVSYGEPFASKADPIIDDVPSGIVDAYIEATVSAARYLHAVFSRELGRMHAARPATASDSVQVEILRDMDKIIARDERGRVGTDPELSIVG